MKTLLPLAALAAGFLVAPGAYAEAPGQSDAIRVVRTADLRLDTEQGVARLDRRLARAARAVCETPASTYPGARRSAQLCTAETIAAFAPQRQALIASYRPAGAVRLSAR